MVARTVQWIGLTYDEARKEGVNPTHDERLRNHHGHLSLHHAHHALHGGGIRHGIGPGLAPRVWVCQKLALLVRRHHVCFPGLERGRRQHVRVCSQVDAADEGAVLPDLRERLLLRRGLEEDHGVVAEDTCQDLDVLSVAHLADDGGFANHDYGNGEQYPPAAGLSVSFLEAWRGYAQQRGIPMDRLHHGLGHFGGLETGWTRWGWAERWVK
jgi:hypothetical protein